MEFDIADLDFFESREELEAIILHEMGHVLGMGTLWGFNDLLINLQTSNPTYVGSSGVQAWQQLTGFNTGVPVSNVGGTGSRGSHWRESVLSNELMTPILNQGVNPLSIITVAGLEDLGFEVNREAADNFVLLSTLEASIIGVGGDTPIRPGRDTRSDYRCNCGLRVVKDFGGKPAVVMINPEIHGEE